MAASGEEQHAKIRYFFAQNSQLLDGPVAVPFAYGCRIGHYKTDLRATTHAGGLPFRSHQLDTVLAQTADHVGQVEAGLDWKLIEGSLQMFGK